MNTQDCILVFCSSLVEIGDDSCQKKFSFKWRINDW